VREKDSFYLVFLLLRNNINSNAVWKTSGKLENTFFYFFLLFSLFCKKVKKVKKSIFKFS